MLAKIICAITVVFFVHVFSWSDRLQSLPGFFTPGEAEGTSLSIGTSLPATSGNCCGTPEDGAAGSVAADAPSLFSPSPVQFMD